MTYAQGYLISRPLTIDRFAAFLAALDPATFVGTDKRAAA